MPQTLRRLYVPCRSETCPPEPRRGRNTILYGVARENLDDFLRLTRERYDKPLPRYAVREWHEYLRCGDLAQGFVRSACPHCGLVLLVPFSCKRRGVCPSCAGRRMTNEAAHLVDRVLPDVPVRRWVLSLPWELRRLAAFRADVVRWLARLFAECVERRLRRRFGGAGRGGGVTFLQRAGGSLNLNVHFHQVALDGVFRARGERLVFRHAEPPTREELSGVLDDFRTRCGRGLRRRGFSEEAGAAHERSPCFDGVGALEGCAGIATQRGLFECREGEGGEPGVDPDELRFGARCGGRWSVELDGYNLHAGVRIAAGDDVGRERLCRYGARPSFALGRLVEWPDGRIGYRVRWSSSPAGPYRVMTALELMARLTALIPPPRYPLVRYHGVLAPASRWRPLVVPRPPPAGAGGCGRASGGPSTGAGSTGDRGRATGEMGDIAALGGGSSGSGSEAPWVLRGPGFPIRDVLVRGPSSDGEDEFVPLISREHWRRLDDGRLLSRSPRIDWASLLARTFGVDALECPKCRGRLVVEELVTKPDEAAAFLAGLGAESPGGAPLARARSPTRRPGGACVRSS